MTTRTRPLPSASLLPPAAMLLGAVFAFAPLSPQAQDGIDEPDPFRVIGEKPGAAVPAAEVPAEPAKPAARPPRPVPNAAAAAEDKPDAPAMDEAKTPLDAQISQHILKLAEGERDTRMSFMRIVIDDIARLCELDGEQQEQLVLAAKGAAERSMKQWHEQAERYFRTRLESADPDTAKEMLEGMGSVNFGGNRSEEEGENLELWKDALQTVLSADQIRRYEEVLERRHLDRIEAFARMSLSTLDDHLRLTPDQRETMSEIVHGSATDYLEDVQRYWGDYFERGMLMSLANVAEEDKLRAFLSEQQYNRLRDATSNFDHFWDQKRRLKRAKEKASERRRKAEDGDGEADTNKDEGNKEVRAEEAAREAVRANVVIDGAGAVDGARVIRLPGGGVRIQARPAAPKP